MYNSCLFFQEARSLGTGAADAHLYGPARPEGVVVPNQMYGFGGGPTHRGRRAARTDVCDSWSKQDSGVAADPDRPAYLVAAIRTLTADSTFEKMGTPQKKRRRGYDRVNELQKICAIVGPCCGRQMKTDEARPHEARGDFLDWETCAGDGSRVFYLLDATTAFGARSRVRVVDEFDERASGTI